MESDEWICVYRAWKSSLTFPVVKFAQSKLSGVLLTIFPLSHLESANPQC